jgi:hypothetical protein
MNDHIRKLADDCGFTILNSPLWRLQGEKFLRQLLLRRGPDGMPLLFTIVQRPLTDEEAEDFLK